MVDHEFIIHDLPFFIFYIFYSFQIPKSYSTNNELDKFL